MTTMENTIAPTGPDLIKPAPPSAAGEAPVPQPVAAPAVVRAPGTRSPLSFAQQRLWFLDQLQPNNPLYNVALALRLAGELDVEALRRSINHIISRHDVLRTRFVVENDGPLQVVDPAGEAEMTMIDLSHHPRSQREKLLERALQDEARRPFVLSRDLLLRVFLVKLDKDEHALLVNMHHIVSDAWSLEVFQNELAIFYPAFKEGTAIPAAELPMQYAAYAAWQREWMNGGVMQKQLAYWKKQLAGAPFLLELPADKPRPAIQTFYGSQLNSMLPQELAADLKRFSRKHGATLFMTLLTAFKVLLHRYTNQVNLIVGSPIAGRNRMETEKLIGFFVNTLALHTDFSGNPTFAEAIARVRRVTLDAFSNQDLPFESLVEELHPTRNSGYTPLVQVMFAYQTGSASALNLPGLTATPLMVDTATSKFDLTMAVEDLPSGLSVSLEYSTDIFAPETVARMLGHFRVLLEAVLADPQRRIGEIPILPAAEREQLVQQWTDTRTDYPRDQTVPGLFAAQARQTPSAIALAFGGKTLTYRELDHQSSRLAVRLQTLGVAAGTVVGVCAERSLELYVGLLGILKAGGAYAAFDPAQPGERLAFMFEDAQPKVWLTQKKFENLRPSPDQDYPVLCLDGDWDAGAHEEMEQPLDFQPQATDVAYVSFTSGSTGRPKGVAVTHRGIVRLVRNTNYAEFRADDVFLQFAPVAFDASTLEIWGALLNGARLVAFPPVMPSLADLGSFIHQQRITTLWLTAGLFHQMVEEQLPALAGVRQLLAGGDVLSVPHVRKALTALKNCQLINGYGPTENTTFTCCHKISERSVQGRSIPIGRPVSNTRVYILNDRLQPAPIGVPGELYAGGDGLALGYLNRPEITAERFVADPFATEPGAKLYRTGDLVRWLPDGNIEFFGRLDSQAKIRGFRVELGEIESALAQHPGIRECAVTTHDNALGEKQVVAYFTTNGVQPESDELRRYLALKLPEYMVPSVFVALPELPLNANGKVNRPALVPPEQAAGLGRRFVMPRNPEEARLVKIWEEVLGVQPIGAEDHFFDLGGHSLLAVRLVAQIEKVFGKRIPVTTIFQLPTVAQLAGALRDDQLAPRYSNLVGIQPRGERPPLVMVHGAGGGMFWGYTNLSHCLDPEQPVYAFKSRGMDGQEEFDSIEEMAAHYVAELRAMQPVGPYHLGGYCFGGNVAYEMARQLEAQGQQTALLALINCSPRGSSYERLRPTPAFCLKFLGNLFYWAGYVFRQKPRDQLHLFFWKGRAMVKKIFRLLFHRVPTGKAIDVDELVDLSGQPPERHKLWDAHIQALMNNRTKPWTGHVTLYRTRGHSLLCSFDHAYGWGDFAGKVTVHVVPGAHESILEEWHVKDLATLLKRDLEGVQAGGKKGKAQ